MEGLRYSLLEDIMDRRELFQVCEKINTREKKIFHIIDLAIIKKKEQ